MLQVFNASPAKEHKIQAGWFVVGVGGTVVESGKRLVGSTPISSAAGFKAQTMYRRNYTAKGDDGTYFVELKKHPEDAVLVRFRDAKKNELKSPEAMRIVEASSLAGKGFRVKYTSNDTCRICVGPPAPSMSQLTEAIEWHMQQVKQAEVQKMDRKVNKKRASVVAKSLQSPRRPSAGRDHASPSRANNKVQEDADERVKALCKDLEEPLREAIDKIDLVSTAGLIRWLCKKGQYTDEDDEGTGSASDHDDNSDVGPKVRIVVCARARACQ